MDKRDRSDIFRKRLMLAMDRGQMSRSALARRTGVDRSTIGQLLKDDLPRLPNAQLAADAAAVLRVSSDWLLGLTNRPERPGDIVAAAMSMSPAERSSADSQLLEWHRESTGYKIRHVPATLPDILKTEGMLDWEYSSQRNLGLDQAIDAMRDQMEWLESGASDYEIALPLHELEACASGSAYYAGVNRQIRHEQLNFIADICESMYPRLRLFVFNARTIFSAPVTVFGPNLAVIYVGQFYLAFREGQRVRSLSDHFDALVRAAEVDARGVSDHIAKLIKAYS